MTSILAIMELNWRPLENVDMYYSRYVLALEISSFD